MKFRKHIIIDTLDDFLAYSWKTLAAGSRKFRHPFHAPVLVTQNGVQPDARTVILRHFSEKQRLLICHSDVRAAKAHHIRKNPKVLWLFYDPKDNFQLRIYGTATVHTDDDIAQNLWKNIRITSRINYCTTLPPGSALEQPSSGLPDFITRTAPHLLDKNTGRGNFAVIRCCFTTMDALLLGVTGHKRARFTWENDQFNATWVVP